MKAWLLPVTEGGHEVKADSGFYNWIAVHLLSVYQTGKIKLSEACKLSAVKILKNASKHWSLNVKVILNNTAKLN